MKFRIELRQTQTVTHHKTVEVEAEDLFGAFRQVSKMRMQAGFLGGEDYSIMSDWDPETVTQVDADGNHVGFSYELDSKGNPTKAD